MTNSIRTRRRTATFNVRLKQIVLWKTREPSFFFILIRRWPAMKLNLMTNEKPAIESIRCISRGFRFLVFVLWCHMFWDIKGRSNEPNENASRKTRMPFSRSEDFHRDESRSNDRLPSSYEPVLRSYEPDFELSRTNQLAHTNWIELIRDYMCYRISSIKTHRSNFRVPTNPFRVPTNPFRARIFLSSPLKNSLICATKNHASRKISCHRIIIVIIIIRPRLRCKEPFVLRQELFWMELHYSFTAI